MIAARLLGIREFSLAALVRRQLDVELGKGFAKGELGAASALCADARICDERHALPVASCRTLRGAIETMRSTRLVAAILRARSRTGSGGTRRAIRTELWRIRGSGLLRGRAAAVLRALWQWREQEAKAADRPPFHVLQNHELLNAAVSFASEKLPDYRHFPRAAVKHFAKQRRAHCNCPKRNGRSRSAASERGQTLG